MQRAYDMVIHDVSLQKLPVVFCLDRAGLVGEDGPTHHGAYDLAYMRCVPGMIIAAPMNEAELRHMMYTAQLEDNKLPFTIRYPRGQGVMPEWRVPMQKLEIGKGRQLVEGKDLAIVSIGHVGNVAMEAIDVLKQMGLSVALYDMRFLKPIDEALLHSVAQNFKHIITIEDGTIVGGLGSAVLEFLADNHYHDIAVHRLGIPDAYIEHGKPEELHAECQYDKQGIINKCKAIFQLEENKTFSILSSN
jgi:1-deoxy-D-xylulose-5-phosphate synthase